RFPYTTPFRSDPDPARPGGQVQLRRDALPDAGEPFGHVRVVEGRLGRGAEDHRAAEATRQLPEHRAGRGDQPGGSVWHSSSRTTLPAMLCSLRHRPGRFANRLSKNWTLVVMTTGASQFSARRAAAPCGVSLSVSPPD